MANRKKQLQSFDSVIRHFLRQYNFATKQDIDRLMQKIENLERHLTAGHPAGKNPGEDACPTRNGSATDTVMDVIAGIGSGANFAEIQEKTQFTDKKLRNIIYRLNKQGKIRRKKRGVYIPA